MTPEIWRQVEELYHAALARGPGERAAALADADPEIRREVEALLAQHPSQDGLLDRPAAELLTSAAKLAPGVMLGPYKIECLIGAGGMGEVFRATDTRLGRAVAIKISSQEFNQRFEREARAISALNHPHICTLHDVGPNYLVMELVEGETLASRLKRGKLPLDEALRYGGQIADALAASHAKGIVHRDLKPANIMVTKTGVKVLDFGLAKIEQGVAGKEHTVTAKGTILGTVQYMSPEQAQGKDADARSDIFSFGLVLYETISGKRAFDGATRASVMAAMLERPAPSLAGMAPVALDRVLQKCLEKDPEERWQDARDLKAALALTSEVEPAAKASRRKWIAGTAAGVFVAGAGAVGWLRRPSVGGDPSLMRVQIEPPPGGRILFATQAGTSWALSPDGKTVAFTAVVGGKTGLWIRPLGGEPRMLAEVYATSPFWSPDSKSVAFGNGSNVMRVDVAGGAPWAVCQESSAGFTGHSWSADGHMLLGSYRGLSRVPASGGTPAPLTELSRSRGERAHLYPKPLPGGRFLYLALSDRPENSGIYAASLARPSERRHLLTTNVSALYAPGGDGKEYLFWQRGGALVAQEFDAADLKITGEPHLVANSIGMASNAMIASVSTNGSIIYSPSSVTTSRLTWFNRDGKPLGTVGETGAYVTLRLSPDERQVSVLLRRPGRQSEIWILQTSRGVATRLADRGVMSAWSPDSRTLVYYMESPPSLFRQEVAGSGNPERITQSPNAQVPCDWSRDGRFLIWQESTSGNEADLMVMELGPDAKPGTIRSWLSTPANETNARFSPELAPRWIAYNSNESGRIEVYVDSFQGRRKKVLVSTDGGRFPEWRGDGKELYFQSLDYRLMAVDVRVLGDSLETSAPRELFKLPIIDHNLSSYEASHDGQRFLVRAAVEQATPLTLIVNWPALLKNPGGQ
jgi:serine/threonine protein kinase